MWGDTFWAKPIFPKSVGPSKIPQRLGPEVSWNNVGDKNKGAAVCQLCGKNHPLPKPDLGESVTLMRFLELQGVEECCGYAADVVYEEFGERFTEVLLKEFAANPSDPRFHSLRILLAQTLREAQENLKNADTQVKEAASTLATLGQQLKGAKPQ